MTVRRAVRGLPAVILVALAACAGGGAEQAPAPGQAAASYRLLGPQEFAEAIYEPERTTINVHVPFEGSLPDTDLEIPFDQIENRIALLPADRSAPIAVYCMSGRMSAEAARTLADLGYTDIVDLDGGMEAWQASGRSILGVPGGP